MTERSEVTLSKPRALYFKVPAKSVTSDISNRLVRRKAKCPPPNPPAELTIPSSSHYLTYLKVISKIKEPQYTTLTTLVIVNIFLLFDLLAYLKRLTVEYSFSPLLTIIRLP